MSWKAAALKSTYLLDAAPGDVPLVREAPIVHEVAVWVDAVQVLVVANRQARLRVLLLLRFLFDAVLVASLHVDLATIVVHDGATNINEPRLPGWEPFYFVFGFCSVHRLILTR